MSQGDDIWGCLGPLILIGGIWYWIAQRDNPPPILTSPYNSNSDSEALDVASPAVAAPQPIQPPPPKRNYQFVENDTYGYVAGIPEDEVKKGKAAGDVLLFRYRGATAGKFRLDRVDASGRLMDYAECSKPCIAIKSWYGNEVQLLEFNRGSVIGAAFEDALAGRLKVWRPALPSKPVPLPVTSAEPPCWETHNAIELRDGVCE